MNTQPFDFVEAVAKCRHASEAQRATEQARGEASKTLAAAERDYRLSYAKEIVEAHSRGVAWTVCQDIARGAPHVAKLRHERDVAAGVVDALEQSSWRHAADRRDLQSLLTWAQRAAFVGDHFPDGAQSLPVIGQRRAA